VPAGCRVAVLTAVRHAGAAHAAVHAAGSHTSLLQKGAHLIMHAGKPKVAVAVACLVVAGAVLPIALRLKADAAPQTSLTFTDSVPIQSSTPGDTAGIRSQIDSDYGGRLDKISRNDPQGMGAFSSPDFTMTYLNGRRVPLASWTRDAAHFFSLFSSVKVTITVSSFKVEGNTATIHAAWHVDGIGGKNAGPEPGHRYVEDRVHEDVWQLRSGAWINVSTTLLSSNATDDGKPIPGSD
jgi:hypothetical protein